MTLTLSYCTLDRSPFFGQPETLVAQCHAAASAGFRLITPDVFSLRAYCAAGGDLDDLAGSIRAAGLQVFDISGINIGTDADAAVAEATEAAAFAAALDARWVQSRVTVDDAASRALYRRCAAIVDSVGCGTALEFSPFTPISSIDTARAFLGAVRDGSARHGIVVDSWHLFRGGEGPAALAQLPLDELAYVQLVDAQPVSDDLRHDTLNRRALPAHGELDLAGFVSALETMGFGGVASVELLSAELRSLDLADYARAVFDAASAITG
jgi:sugar phosphate isomerase/epimerase